MGASSQYILQSLLSSGNLNNGKAANPLLKGLEQFHLSSIRHHKIDAGYDFESINEHQMGHKSNIAYNKLNESKIIGYDEHFAPTCFLEHSYRYDSYDPKYATTLV